MEPIVYSKPTVNVELTDSAISKLLERTAEKGVSAIRLGITGGGCGGYEYIFDYNTTSEPNDQILDFGKFTIHIDATFTPIKEGLIINNPQRRLPKEQRKLFEDNGWEIVDSAQPAHNEPPPLCYSSTWLSMNVLILDPKTVCVEKSEVYQAEQLDKLGMEVVPVELRDAYAFGGGLHCCTADVYREGELKDYFPKQ